MTLRKTLFTAAFLLVASLGGNARADYSYVTAITPGTITFGGSVLTFAGRTDTVLDTPPLTQINAAGIHLTSGTTPPATDTLSPTTFTISVIITNNGQTGTLSFTESITGFANSQISVLDTTLVSYSNPAGLNIGGTVFTLNAGAIGAVDFLFSAPTVNGADGSQSVRIQTAPVPEPASVAMLGLGLVSLGGFALRRRMAK